MGQAGRADRPPLAGVAGVSEPVHAGRAVQRALRRAGQQHQGQRDGGGGDQGGDAEAGPLAQAAEPGGQDQRTALPDAQRRLQPAEPLVPLRFRPPLHDQQVRDRDRAGEARAVHQGEQQLQRGVREREQPQADGGQGRAQRRQEPVCVQRVGHSAGDRRGERAEVERPHDQADVPGALLRRHQRQQDRGEPDRRSVDQRERREPGLEEFPGAARCLDLHRSGPARPGPGGSSGSGSMPKIVVVRLPPAGQV